MKITDVKTIPVSYELDEPMRWGEFEIEKKGAVLIRILTDEGLKGIGEAGFSVQFYDRLKPIVNRLKSTVVGCDPEDIKSIWERIYRKTHQWGRRGMQTYAISGIDIALWDLFGKICGKPIYKILGGHGNDFKTYFAPSLKEAEIIAEESRKGMNQGFEAIKLRTGLGKEEDLRIVSEVRETVGEEMTLMVDANMAYDFRTAVEMGKKFSDYSILWYEEPVKTHSLEQYVDYLKRLSNSLSTKISGGESLFTKYEYKNLISRSAVDVVQPDCTGVGGITEAKIVASMAEAWNIHCVPHISCSSCGTVGFAANLHLIGSISNSLYVEYDPYVTPLRRELAKNPLMAKDGHVKIPEEPGLGLKIDEDSLIKYSENMVD